VHPGHKLTGPTEEEEEEEEDDDDECSLRMTYDISKHVGAMRVF
jgi:hypothetical protein